MTKIKISRVIWAHMMWFINLHVLIFFMKALVSLDLILFTISCFFHIIGQFVLTVFHKIGHNYEQNQNIKCHMGLE